MNIGINARLLLQNKLEGIGWFAYQVLSRMVRNHPEHQFYFFFDRPYAEEFVFGNNVTPIVIGPQARHPALYYIWFNARMAPLLKRYKIDVLFSPEGFIPHRTRIPQIATIHDLAYLHYPEQIDLAHRYWYRRYQPKYANKAEKIVTVSEFTKQDIVQQYGLPEEKIQVVYNAANPIYKPLSAEEKIKVREEISGGRNYFLFVGALHPRKNIINLLKAFVQFKRRQQCVFKLVIVGRMAWQTEEIEEAKRRMPYKEDVIWLGYKSVEELSKIMGAAYALVYPSLFEGFGIPIIEAMACDVPSIVSNTSSMPEVAGTAALLCDPHNPKDIAEKMSMIYKDEHLHRQLSANCHKELQRFDWDKSAEQIWKIIEEVGSKK